MGFFAKLVQSQQSLASYEEREKALIDAELSLYRKEKELAITAKLQDRKTDVIDLEVKCAKDTGSLECEYYEKREEKKIKLAKIDAQIEARELALSAVKDVKQLEIELLKDIHSKAIADKDKMIELLVTQVEVLTAKLTEIKISDVHLNVQAKTE